MQKEKHTINTYSFSSCETADFNYDNLALKKSLELISESLFNPPTHRSADYKNWIAILDIKTCIECRKLHGKIYLIDENIEKEPPLHNNCRCEIEKMPAVFTGTATKEGTNGADVFFCNR